MSSRKTRQPGISRDTVPSADDIKKLDLKAKVVKNVPQEALKIDRNGWFEQRDNSVTSTTSQGNQKRKIVSYVKSPPSHNLTEKKR
jgi:hypothetical protein